jgi:hypothetical protein
MGDLRMSRGFSREAPSRVGHCDIGRLSHDDWRGLDKANKGEFGGLQLRITEERYAKNRSAAA